MSLCDGNVIYVLKIKGVIFSENFYILLASYVLFHTFLVRNKLDGFTIPMCKQMEVSYINHFLLHFLSSDSSEFQK
jgi:hypothetical protein